MSDQCTSTVGDRLCLSPSLSRYFLPHTMERYFIQRDMSPNIGLKSFLYFLVLMCCRTTSQRNSTFHLLENASTSMMLDDVLIHSIRTGSVLVNQQQTDSRTLLSIVRGAKEFYCAITSLVMLSSTCRPPHVGASHRLLATTVSTMSFYSLSALRGDGVSQPMEDYRGKVVYATNVASW